MDFDLTVIIAPVGGLTTGNLYGLSYFCKLSGSFTLKLLTFL